MSRRTAAVAGLVAWLVALLFVPDRGVRALVVWGVLSGVAVAVSICCARLLSRELRRAVLKDHS